jgi:type II secretory pathway pseudopilin PulG
MKRQRTSAFSLVEVTLAVGIAAFCLIAVSGLLPVGIQTNRNAKSQTRATNLMAAVMADLRATPSTKPASLQFCIPFTTSPPPLYFDSEGRCSSDLAGLTSCCSCCGGINWSPALQTRYQVNVTFPLTGNPNLMYADLKATWPAPATPANASGSVEMFAAFDRY